MNHKVADSYP